VREIVIVVADLYLRDTPDAAPCAALPALDRIARFGERLALERGWRAWLAGWIGRRDLTAVPVSAVAAAARQETTPGSAVAAGRSEGAADEPEAWMATPVYLAAGLTTLYFDARGILRLSRQELEQLALDARRAFPDLQLVPLESGEFLLLHAAIPAATTTEPARIVGGNLADALPAGAGGAHLRRLGAEMEMWLHEHPVNRARSARGELPISTLWIWGGGPHTRIERKSSSSLPRAFGSDSYLQGLWRLCGGAALSLPQQLDDTYAQSTVLVVEAGRMMRANVPWSVPELLAEVDRRFVAPALQALQRRKIERVSIVANDRCLTLGSSSWRRFWRRSRPALQELR
jgi:hypothetical protein